MAIMESEKEEHKPNYPFLLSLAFVEVIVFIFFASFVDYADATDAEDATSLGSVSKYYAMYQDVHIMIFIGFGFLMIFLRKNAFSALGHTLLIGCLSIQLGIMWINIFHDFFQGHEIHLHLEIPDLVKGDFAAGATLISFGAVLGRVTPTQIIWMVFFELIFYSINEYIGVEEFKAVDMGGSMYVHTFGAYFGLAFSWMVGVPCKNEEDEASVYHSDALAMIGTIFLWCFWPSFNGVLAGENFHQQERVVINTVIALTCSAISAFFFSHLTCGKFDMVHIQNASLAGGVAIGSSSDLVVGPHMAIITGLIAGGASTLGYVYLTPKLNRWGIYDVCGIHNLHGMPGVIGGIGGAISAASATGDKYGENIEEVFAGRAHRTAGQQGLFQFWALLVTMAMAIFGGLFSGLLITYLSEEKKTTFSDEDDWEVPLVEFVSTYFEEKPKHKTGNVQENIINSQNEI